MNWFTVGKDTLRDKHRKIAMDDVYFNYECVTDLVKCLVDKVSFNTLKRGWIMPITLSFWNTDNLRTCEFI